MAAELTPRRLAVAGVAIAILAVLLTLPPWLVRATAVPVVVVALAAGLGLVALRRGDRQAGAYALVAAAFALVVILAVEGAQRSTVTGVVTAGLFAGMLQYATPLGFAGLGGLISERSGVVNIGLEGMMLIGAFFGIYACDKLGGWYWGLLGAAVAGGAMALVHAIFAIHLQADQIVSGTAINILALGITTYAFRAIYGSSGTPSVSHIPRIHVPGLASLPYVGRVLGTMNLMIWLMLLLVAVVWLFVFKTPWGLRLRAVGEHPRAADTVGIDVYRVRYLAVVTSGVLAALGGAYLSFGLLSSFNENMTGGRGFIALAAMIFGKWRPLGTLGAVLLFGFATSLGNGLQTSAGISADLVSMLPYILTLVALVGLVGRSIPPAADGLPYAKQ